MYVENPKEFNKNRICIAHTEPEITVGHQIFSDQMYVMSEHFRFWSDIMSGQNFLYFIDLMFLIVIV